MKTYEEIKAKLDAVSIQSEEIDHILHFILIGLKTDDSRVKHWSRMIVQSRLNMLLGR